MRELQLYGQPGRRIGAGPTQAEYQCTGQQQGTGERELDVRVPAGDVMSAHRAEQGQSEQAGSGYGGQPHPDPTDRHERHHSSKRGHDRRERDRVKPQRRNRLGTIRCWLDYGADDEDSGNRGGERPRYPWRETEPSVARSGVAVTTTRWRRFWWTTESWGRANPRRSHGSAARFGRIPQERTRPGVTH